MQDIKSKKKVCLMVTKGVWGGAQKYVYTLAISLPKNQYDVFVVVGQGGILNSKLLGKNIRTYEISDLKRDISIVSEIKSFISLFKILRKEKPDVLHLNSPKAGGLGAVAGRLCRVPRITQTIHGWTFNENRKTGAKIVIWFFSYITTILCHKTIVIAEREEKQGKIMPFVKSRITLIKNGIEPILFKEKDLSKKELLKMLKTELLTFSDYTLWLGTISELHKNKGLEYAISAVSKISIPFVFFIIGEGEERKNLENLIEKHNLENKVFLVGFLDNANQYLKAFDIFTLTSIKEGLPYTILEAGLAGLTGVASSVGG